MLIGPLRVIHLWIVLLSSIYFFLLTFCGFTLYLPIHSSANSSDWLRSLQYCSDKIISFGCGLNLSSSISYSPFTVSCASCSTTVRVFISFNHSLSIFSSAVAKLITVAQVVCVFHVSVCLSHWFVRWWCYTNLPITYIYILQ